MKEVVPDADGPRLEQILPDPYQVLVHEQLRRHVARGVAPVRARHLGQATAVGLAGRQPRHGRQLGDDGGLHGAWQFALEMSTQVELVDRLGPARHHVGHELLVLAVPPRHDDRLLDRGMLGGDRLDLAELYPVAAHLDLIVHPAEVDDPPVVQEAHAVAGPVEPSLAPGIEGIADEPLVGELRPVQISAGQQLPSHVQLAHRTDRDGLPGLVEDVHRSPRQRAADRHESLLLSCVGECGRDDAFGRSVGVEQSRLDLERAPLCKHLAAEPLAAQNHQAQPQPGQRRGCPRPDPDRLLPIRGPQVHDRHPAQDQLLAKLLGGPDLTAADDEARPGGQRREDLLE